MNSYVPENRLSIKPVVHKVVDGITGCNIYALSIVPIVCHIFHL